jgi:hypothetical protein
MMALSAGDRLGRDEILGPLGAGGMGEVYRARGTELERDVAIKVLPEAVSQNPDRLARFEREAKAVARFVGGVFTGSQNVPIEVLALIRGPRAALGFPAKSPRSPCRADSASISSLMTVNRSSRPNRTPYPHGFTRCLRVRGWWAASGLVERRCGAAFVLPCQTSSRLVKDLE